MKKTKAAAVAAAEPESLSTVDAEPSDERAPNRLDSKFRFVLVAAQRAEQLMRGARAKTEVPGKQKPTKVAMAEITQDLVVWDYGPAPAPEPAAEEQAAVEEVH